MDQTVDRTKKAEAYKAMSVGGGDFGSARHMGHVSGDTSTDDRMVWRHENRRSMLHGRSRGNALDLLCVL